MAMEFQSIDAFVAFLARQEAEVHAARHRGLQAAGTMLEAEAKSMVGQELEEWPALAASTVARKEAKGQTGRVSSTDPNFATGEYRATISHDVQSHSVVLGSPDPIAPYLEYGTSRMPPRPVITATMFHKGQDAARLAASHILGAVAGRAGPIRSRAG